MPTHFTALGFPAETREQIGSLMYEAARHGDSRESASGFYALFDTEGAQLWVQSIPHEGKRKIVGINPHYAGTSRNRVKLVRTVVNPEYPLDGALYAWAEPGEEVTETGDYPFVFSVPDFEIAVAGLNFPSLVTVQLAAFARRLVCFENDEAYQEWQKTKADDTSRGLAPESFIPTGLFIAQENPDHHPTPEALFAGHVEVAEVRTNALTGRPFQYLRVKTFGATFDVVIDPQVIQGTPVVGGVIEGSFWLSGRIVENNEG